MKIIFKRTALVALVAALGLASLSGSAYLRQRRKNRLRRRPVK